MEEATVPQNMQEVSETDVEGFWQAVDAWQSTLSEKEQMQFSALVVLAAGQENEVESYGQAQDEQQAALSEAEVDAFMQKLEEFHDTLPEGQHQILDALVGRAFASDENEVEPYWYQLWRGWIPQSRVNHHLAQCRAAGGGWGFLYPYRSVVQRGTRYTDFGCWVP